MQNILLDLLGSTDLSAGGGGAGDLVAATDLSNAVHKKNSRNANDGVAATAPVSHNQDLLDLLDLDMSSTTSTGPPTGVGGGGILALAGDKNQSSAAAAVNMNNMLGGLDLGGFGSGLVDGSAASIPTNGNDLASMLSGLSSASAAPLAAAGNLIDGNLLADLNPTAASNNAGLVVGPA